MRRKWMLIGAPCAIAMSLVTFALYAAPNQRVCQQVMSACLDAGFVQGGGREGNGLWKDCIDPIMQGTAQRGASLPLPPVNPRVVAACRTVNPAFGQPKWARGGRSAPRVARPAAPALNGGTKAKGPEKPADVAKAPESPADSTESAPKASADMPPPLIPGDKPAEGPSSLQMSASESASTPPTPSSVTSSGPSGSSSTSPTPPSAGAAASGEPTQTASVEPAVNSPSGTTRFGIEIGTVEKQGGLWPLWQHMLSKHAALVAGLRARRTLAPDKKWHLIAGPFGSAAEATQACSLFKKENLKCEATVFAGDEL
jgi:hypothetical protein